MAKTTGKSISKKSTGRPPQKSRRIYGGNRAVATKYNKPPSTTNYGTRPTKTPTSLPPTTIYGRAKPASVMPGQPGVPTGNKVSVMPGQPGIPTGGTTVKRTAAPIVKTPNTVNRAAALASNLAKMAASQQQHNAVARTAMNHPTEVASGPSGGNTRGGGFSTGGGGGGTGATVVPTPAVIAPVKPVVSPTAPAVTSPTSPGGPSNVGSFTSRGGNMTAGQFNRRRLNRGPRTGMSITPEMLQRIAAQRIGPT